MDAIRSDYAQDCPSRGIGNIPLHMCLTLAIDEQLVAAIIQGDVILAR